MKKKSLDYLIKKRNKKIKQMCFGKNKDTFLERYNSLYFNYIKKAKKDNVVDEILNNNDSSSISANLLYFIMFSRYDKPITIFEMKNLFLSCDKHKTDEDMIELDSILTHLYNGADS
jgi:hypothetical protein